MSSQVAFVPPELAHSAFGFMGYRLRANSRSRKKHSRRYAVNIKQNNLAVVNWVFYQSFRVRTF